MQMTMIIILCCKQGRQHSSLIQPDKSRLAPESIDLVNHRLLSHLMTRFRVMSSLLTFWYAGLESMALYHLEMFG